MKTPSAIKKELDQSARALEKLIVKSRRQLLEFEVALSRDELARGKGRIYHHADELVDKLT